VPGSFYARTMSESSYHHGHLREALIDEAVSAVRSEGPSGLGIRSLARRVGVSHNAAYRHFEDLDGLVAAVAEQVNKQLLTAMRRRLDAVDEPDPTLRARRRLAETGRAYVEFALSETALFRVAFGSAANPVIDARPPGADPLKLLGQVLDELVDVGFLGPEARVDAELTCWSSVHGFSILCIDGPLSRVTEAERTSALDRVLVAIDRSYGASTGTPTKPEDILF